MSLEVSIDIDSQALLDGYRTMVRIREFELAAERLLREGKLTGNLHLSTGQEAVAAGFCASLLPSDVITTTHRGHGHCIAKGGEPERMFAELLGFEHGYCKGRAGSMHIADPRSGILGATAIVGGGYGMAVGAALTFSVQQTAGVAVAFFGEGAVAEGAFHEALNIASLWKLPVIFCCENNQYAELTPVSVHLSGDVYRFADPYGVPGCRVDGNDLQAVGRSARAAIDRARAGAGPTLVECTTYRTSGHYVGDPERYRDKDEVLSWSLHDPIRRALDQLADLVPTSSLAEIHELAKDEMVTAIGRASAGSVSSLKSMHQDLYARTAK